MNVTSIVKRQEHVGDDPLRAALAAAIEAEAEARSAVDTADENLKRGHAVVAAAEAQLESARKLVENARARDVRAMSATIRNKSAGASPDATMTRQARAAVQEKEDNLDVAQGSIARLEQDVSESETALLWAIVERTAAANAALVPTCRELLDRARDARRVLAVSKASLAELLNERTKDVPAFGDDMLGRINAREQVTAPLSALRSEAGHLYLAVTTDAERAAADAAAAEMTAYIARLATDSTSEPPAIP
jgi:hypothetical protein